MRRLQRAKDNGKIATGETEARNPARSRPEFPVPESRGYSELDLQLDFSGRFGLTCVMAEKSLNEISRDVRLLYQKGSDALLRENYDYAIDLFNQVLQKEPTLYDCRKALRSAQAKKAGDGKGIFKKVWNSASSAPMVGKGQMALRKDPVEALQIAEQILNGDPTNAGAHRIVAEAAIAMQMPKTAVLSLDTLVRNSPKDKTLAIQLARALADSGEVHRAEKVLIDIGRLMPHDAEISQALKDFSARKTMSEGGYDALSSGEGSYRDILRNEGEAVSLEQENRVQKSEDTAERLIQEKETKLKAEPNNLKTLRDLAELYTQKKQFERALEYYEKIKATEVGGSDPTLDRAIADTKVRRLEHEIEQLDPTAPDYTEKAAAMNAEKLAFQVAECQKRVEKFGTDLAIRYEMGVLYFQAGKITEAIQEFQKAQNNAHKKIPSMNYLAQCFAKRKMYDLAARTLQNALKEKVVFDDEKKNLIYNLGSVLEAMAKKEDAIEQFKQIYEIDAGYKDVSKKIDDYYAGQ
jgi:tetratricopeptide (TPR) repeat protein